MQACQELLQSNITVTWADVLQSCTQVDPETVLSSVEQFDGYPMICVVLRQNESL